ncbi:hypothetical protein TNCV_3530771 [Trichonephila clavipes]|uniref:Uncharacterized protein n=1 Tax=Trichonephila clavipes TaxID=2585209 RepID=A0A8X6VPD1_TRICX|nr:hypothetical protein TNCV_3530771 [Trichonephila clavipes]
MREQVKCWTGQSKIGPYDTLGQGSNEPMTCWTETMTALGCVARDRNRDCAGTRIMPTVEMNPSPVHLTSVPIVRPDSANHRQVSV